MKRFILISLAVMVAIAIGGGIVFYQISRHGSGAIEGWIGSQFLGIANSHLNPKLSFDGLDYSYPTTVSLKNLRLEAEDPANPGRTIDILGCRQAKVTLAEIPSVGKPVIIEQIVLDEPLFSAIATAPDSREYVGFSNLIRRSATAPTTAATRPASQGRHLSDAFRIRLLRINGGRILYDPRIAGAQTMVLDQINTTLNVEHAETGWYTIDTSIARNGLFDLAVSGQINLDTFTARDMTVKLHAALSQDKLDFLPPPIQKTLRQYQVQGDLMVSISGSMPVMRPLSGDVRAEATLTDANLTLGEFRVPVQDLHLVATMQNGRLDLPTLKIAALGGTADASGSAALAGAIDTSLKLKIAGMQISGLLATTKAGEPPTVAGIIQAEAQAHAPLKVLIGELSLPATQPAQAMPAAATQLPDNWGSASIQITRGRLVRLPVIGRLTAAIIDAARIIIPQTARSGEPTEEAQAQAIFRGDEVQFTDLRYVGQVIAARGKGSVGLDRRLDLTFSAGPVQTVTSLLGKELGGAFGAVTDKLVSYRVTGVVAEPKVGVQVAGGAVNEVGKAIQGGAGAIGEGIKNIGEGIGNIGK